MSRIYYNPEILTLKFQKPPPVFNHIEDVYFLRNQYYDQLIYNHNNMNPDDKVTNSIDSSYKEKIKIVIYTPELDISCGGVIVLHYLAQTLKKIAPDNFEILLYSYNYKKYDNIFCDKFFNPNLIDDKTIVIYPEVMGGNPLNSRYCIRWILLELGIDTRKEQIFTWNKNDLVYHWEPNKNINSKQLINLWIDPYIKNYNTSDRHRNCYAYKKINHCAPGVFHKKIQTYHSRKDICLDTHYNKKKSIPIIGIFNNCDKFYCYDPNTFYSVMAPLCGCITVLHPVDGIDKKQFLSSRILKYNNVEFDSGIAYGNDKQEIEHARDTIKNAKENFNNLVEEHKKTLYSFLLDINNLINQDLLPNNTVKNIYNV